MGGTRGTYGEQTNAYRVWVRKPEAKRQLGRSSLIWEYNIETGLI